jgi:hypothetical protein
LKLISIETFCFYAANVQNNCNKKSFKAVSVP